MSQKKVKPKDVNLEEEEANLQPTPIPVYPGKAYKRKNLGEMRAEMEANKRRERPEYPGVEG